MNGEQAPLEIDCRTVRDRLAGAGCLNWPEDRLDRPENRLDRPVDRLDRPEDRFLLVDCREPDEWNLVHIQGARLVPMSQFVERLAELLPWKDAPLAVHCHHGGRSLRVVNWLREQGFSQAQSMAGGIDAWAIEIEPGMARY